MPSPDLSRRLRRRLLLVVACWALVALAAFASLAVGTRTIALADVLGALFDGLENDDAVVVTSQRLPRTLVGLAAGLALGAAGALMQGHTRNALADPGLFGVTAGASFGVVLVVYVFGVSGQVALLAAALGGALLATAAVFGMSALLGRGGTPITVALTGTAVSAILFSLMTVLILLDRQSLNVWRFWSVGSLAGRELSTAVWITPLIVLGLVLALANAPAVDLLALGDDVARTLGQRVGLARAVGVAAITLLTAAATAACGPIGFVGLVVPHAARALVGPAHRWLVPLSALLGAALLLTADVIGRVAVPDRELQVGIILAVVGAPVIVALVRRRRLVSL